MDDDKLQRAFEIIEEGVTNIELISYFKDSTKTSPVFLSQINRNWAEIKPLLKAGLIQDVPPVKSYVFYMDKLENFFYENYQEKIDILKEEINKKKRRKVELIEITEAITPQEGEEDYEIKLAKALEFAKQSIQELDVLELEKEDRNEIIAELQEKMKEDPIYKLLFYVRNDSTIIFNKRTEDDEQKVRNKLLNYLVDCYQELGKQVFKELKRGGFLKEYSPAKNYYITDLGLAVDSSLKQQKWEREEEFEMLPEELSQEEEFKKLQAQFGF